MIHSLAGGNLGNEQYLDFALVEIVDGKNVGKFWYKTKLRGLNIGDIVLVEFGREKVKAKVVRVDKNVSSFASPIPIKKAKEIIKKLNSLK